VRYLAIGDSYTIGTSVAAAGSWPAQLADRLKDLQLELVANLAVNGYTSGDLIQAELPRLARLRPDLVTVQIGVNDVVQGVAEERYGSNVSEILDTLLRLLPAERLLGVATPDYTVMPQGGAFGVPEVQSAGIARNNQIIDTACAARGVAFVPQIFEISRRAGNDPAMVAADGLHPSAAQYSRWVDVIEPVVRGILRT
jgi:lysophospholipase L1-like esterase